MAQKFQLTGRTRIVAIITGILIVVIAFGSGIYFLIAKKSQDSNQKNPEKDATFVPKQLRIEKDEAEYRNAYIYSSSVGILFSPINEKKVYLITQKGDVIKQWNTDFLPAAEVKLDKEGNLWRMEKIDDELFKVGGKAGQLSKYSWNGDLVWRYTYNTPEATLHHAFDLLPNGNVLAQTWNAYSKDQMVTWGRDPGTTPNEGMWLEGLIEIKPTGTTSGDIVWSWNVADHLIQEFAPNKQNFGPVLDNKDKIDVNIVTDFNPQQDWAHGNSVDYNPENNQILLTLHAFDEIWVIDKKSNSKDSKIEYRYGNSRIQKQFNNQSELVRPHDGEWNTVSGRGDILVFSNGKSSGHQYSSVMELKAGPQFSYGGAEVIWSYQNSEKKEDFFSPILSGAQRLRDGTTLITNGVDGYCFVVDRNGDTIWKYEYKSTSTNLNQVFRFNAYDLNNLPTV